MAQIDPSSLELQLGGKERAAGVYMYIHDCRERRNQQRCNPKCEGYILINNLSHDGRGIARVEGKKVFIEGALPGEKVTFSYLHHHPNYDEGKVVEIVQSSPDRTAPACPHFSICGGCSLQHLQSEAQLALKQSVLLEQLQHFGDVKPQALLPPITGPIWHYRYKARLGVKYVIKKNKLLIGFHEKNGRYLADINVCPILHAAVGDKISDLSNLLCSLSIFQHIPQVEIACGDDEAAIVIRHLQEFTEADLEKLHVFAKENKYQIYLQPKGLETIHCITDEPSHLLSYTLQEGKIKLFFHPTDFTQINYHINQKVVDKVVELLALKKNERVLDLFCGIGNFTLPMAKHCGICVGVEGSDLMVQRATFNANHNNISNAQFYAADLAQEVLYQNWVQQHFDKILLDPPRTGALAIVQKLAKFKAQKIVYVSCNPATLARDAKELVQQGYKLKMAGIIDMFPHTSHVEAIAVFDS